MRTLLLLLVVSVANAETVAVISVDNKGVVRKHVIVNASDTTSVLNDYKAKESNSTLKVCKETDACFNDVVTPPPAPTKGDCN